MENYKDVYSDWQTDSDSFWLNAAKDIDWITSPSQSFDPDSGVYGRWFPDAIGNTCYNSLDRHIIAGRGEQAALIYDSPVSGRKLTYSYNQLFDKVTALAWGLQELGVVKGDRVIIYLPMIPEAAFAMLACARIGAIHSVVFGGFASKELATRIDDAKPKVILSASCGLEPKRTIPYKPLLDEAINIADHKPDHCLIYQRPECTADLDKVREQSWQTVVSAAPTVDTRPDCVAVKATDP